MNQQLLPTAVVGSYSVPEWLERIATDYFQRRISADTLHQIQDVAIKAAVKDQELAGIDVVTDGELRRDNMVDHFAVRLAGVEIDRRQKAYYFDYYEAVARHALPRAPIGLSDEFLFARRITDHEVKFCVTGPHTLAKRIGDEWYRDERAFARDLAGVLNAELRALVGSGATFLQIDEPYLSGYPDDVDWVVDVWNTLLEGVEARTGLHICYGNRYGKPSWEGSYRYLFPRILDTRVDQLLLEFARKGTDDLALFREFPNQFELGMGVVDVKDDRVEAPAEIAARIRRGLEIVPAERLWLNPDCGLRHLAPDVAYAKLQALAQGAALVREELGGRRAEER
jgi:5-methyltetrahydropteroyltriglutamate--homocysteine methyltransferase